MALSVYQISNVSAITFNRKTLSFSYEKEKQHRAEFKSGSVLINIGIGLYWFGLVWFGLVWYYLLRYAAVSS